MKLFFQILLLSIQSIITVLVIMGVVLLSYKIGGADLTIFILLGLISTVLIFIFGYIEFNKKDVDKR